MPRRRLNAARPPPFGDALDDDSSQLLPPTQQSPDNDSTPLIPSTRDALNDDSSTLAPPLLSDALNDDSSLLAPLHSATPLNRLMMLRFREVKNPKDGISPYWFNQLPRHCSPSRPAAS
ncbi:hypothetical protein EUGRSUZ_L03338 [Eucalyptus grandis]|uniref:Uncharacterized protein n=1 Tax=Eucalyptus grandis TaxID=71139 RepID=A0AAD9WIE1_EUCGR|nr:hypothetical protein EUGRSUZ_L03338 [Eucalyptus grandis]